MGDWTGTVPGFTVERAKASEFQTMADILSALTGPSTAFAHAASDLTLGAGTMTAQYRRVGKWVDWDFTFLLGIGSAVGTSPEITLPAAPAARYVNAAFSSIPVGHTYLFDNGTGAWVGLAHCLSGSLCRLSYSTEAGAGGVADITATVPFTWTTNDKLIAYGRYEAA